MNTTTHLPNVTNLRETATAQKPQPALPHSHPPLAEANSQTDDPRMLSGLVATLQEREQQDAERRRQKQATLDARHRFD